MNSTQIGGLIRTVLAWVGGYVIAKGWLPSDLVTNIIGLGTVLAVAGWSWYTNSTPVMVAAIAESPDVHKVVVTPALAMATPNLKVVAK